MYKFYVGDEDDITKIVVTWEGKGTGVGKLQVWDDDATAWDTDMQEAFTLTDTEYTITITDSTDVTVAKAISSDGYVYFQAFTDADGETLSTDYVSLSVTYDAIDWSDWTGLNAPSIVTRNYIVPERWIGVHRDDQTAFEAAAELAVGDWWLFALPIKNASSQEIIARLTMIVPEALNVYAVSADQVDDYNPRVTKVTRIGANTWKFLVAPEANKQDDDDYLYIIVNAHSDAQAGVFTISGLLEQVDY